MSAGRGDRPGKANGIGRVWKRLAQIGRRNFWIKAEPGGDQSPVNWITLLDALNDDGRNGYVSPGERGTKRARFISSGKSPATV